MNKRGLSSVVTALILILLVLVAIGLIWFVVNRILTESSSQIDLGRLTTEIEIISESVFYNQDTGDLDFMIKKNPGGEKQVEGIRIEAYYEDEIYSEKKIFEQPLKDLETALVRVSLSLEDFPYVTKIRAYPIYISETTGEEVVVDKANEYVLTTSQGGGGISGGNGGSNGDDVIPEPKDGEEFLDLIENLVLYLPFDNSLEDFSESNLDAVCLNEPCVFSNEAMKGQSLSRDGLDAGAYAKIGGDHSVLSGMDDFAISVWAKKNHASTGGIIYYRHVSFFLGIDKNLVDARLYDKDGNTIRLSGEVYDIYDEDWHWYYISVKNNEAKLYIDNFDNLIDQEYIETPLYMPSSRELLFGRNPWDDGNGIYAPFDGFIDEFKIFKNIPEVLVPEESNLVNLLSSTGQIIDSFTSIKSCSSIVQAGQTCSVNSGTYDEIVSSYNSGTQTQPVTFKANGVVNVKSFRIYGEHTTVDGFRIVGHDVYGDDSVLIGKAANYTKLINNYIGDYSGDEFSDLIFRDNGATGDSITTSSGNFLETGFKTGDTIKVSTVESLSGVDGEYKIKAITEKEIIIETNPDLLNPNIHESALINYGPVLAYVRITLNTIYFEPGGLFPEGASHDCLVRNNVFNNTNSMVVTLFGTHHIVENNTFNNINGGDAFRGFGKDHILRYNYITSPWKSKANHNHADLFQTFGNNGHRSYNITMDHNFYHNVDSQISMLSQDNIRDIRDLTYSNNVIYNVSAQAGSGIPGIQWINNTLYRATKNTGHPAGFAKEDIGYARTNMAKNNVFIDCGTDNDFYGTRGWYWVGAGITDIVGDYNYVSGPKPLYSPKKESDFRAGGREAHGINGVVDPLFQNIDDPLGPDGIIFTADDGLIPIPNSPLCNAGENGQKIGAYECKQCENGYPIPSLDYETDYIEKYWYEPLIVSFDASQSSSCASSISSYQWSFGDGSSGNGAFVEHEFLAGTYEVTLTVTNNLGKSSSIKRIIKVGDVDGLHKVLHLKFDGDLEDSSGRDYDGVWVGGDSNYISGKIGQAAEFKGTTEGSSVSISHRDGMDNMDELTVSFWAKKNSVNEKEYVIHKYLSYHIQILENGFDASVYNSDAERFYLLADSALNNNVNWHLYTLTYDSSTMKLFIDGNEVASRVVSGKVNYKPERPLGVGRDPWGEIFNGGMDDLRVYDRVLSNAEISQLASV